ncbi:MAG: hypothetical protein WDN69_26145 [Aliidongia sp.]
MPYGRITGWIPSGIPAGPRAARRVTGITDWLTLEGHGETTKALALLGVGAAVQVGAIGVFNAAVADSTGPRRLAGSRRQQDRRPQPVGRLPAGFVPSQFWRQRHRFHERVPETSPP